MKSLPHQDFHKHETRICKRCQQPFECKMGDVNNCQCASVMLSEETRLFLEKTTWGCLCARCLKELDDKLTSLKGQPFPLPGEMKPGFHYYVEHGLFVFTENYHLLRGNCCQSGCRHCPYGYNK